MTLANKITVGRIVLIPVIVIGLLQHRTTWVALLFFFSILSDFLDGLAARRRGERTKLGAFLDPMADKLLLTAVYITLTTLGKIQMWVFVVTFSRDLLIVLGWIVIYILTGASNIEPRPLGKITTAVQMAAALVFVMNLPDPFSAILLWCAIACTTASAIDYIIVGEKKLGAWN